MAAASLYLNFKVNVGGNRSRSKEQDRSLKEGPMPMPQREDRTKVFEWAVNSCGGMMQQCSQTRHIAEAHAMVENRARDQHSYRNTCNSDARRAQPFGCTIDRSAIPTELAAKCSLLRLEVQDRESESTHMM